MHICAKSTEINWYGRIFFFEDGEHVIRLPHPDPPPKGEGVKMFTVVYSS